MGVRIRSRGDRVKEAAPFPAPPVFNATGIE